MERHGITMKNKIKLTILGLISALTLTACGSGDPALTKFKTEMDKFCTVISELDTSINEIDAEADTAINELLGYLDELDGEFRAFSKVDFPEEFDYLESLADEASEYMTEAVNKYHEAYSNGSYNEYIAEYARENYSRAYKRIQIIISFLHGEEPEDVDLTMTTE